MREYQDYLNIHDGIVSEFVEAEFLKRALSYRRIYDRFLPKSKDSKILDVGCGTGLFLYYLKHFGYKNHSGIDISKENIEFVRENITGKCEYIDMFEYLSGKENWFDMIVMNDVLEHVAKEKAIRLVELVYKSLKIKGLVLIRVPNMENPVAVYQRWADFTHSVSFTGHSLKMVLRLGGFRDIAVYPTAVFGKRSLLEKTVGTVVRFVTRKYLEKVFQYPKDGILFSKRILAVAEK